MSSLWLGVMTVSGVTVAAILYPYRKEPYSATSPIQRGVNERKKKG
jgi:hypothetical protein